MAEQLREALEILRLNQVKQRCGLSRSTIYSRVKEGTFPPPVDLGPNSVGWLASEVERWIEDRIAARDAA
jgi:prophage regulatory protein